MSARMITANSALPANLEAEAALLAALVLEPARIEEVLTAPVGLDAAHFFHEPHQQIFAALATMRDQGDPVDIITLTAHLTRAGLLEKMGGVTALAQLFERPADPSSASHYAEMIKDRALLRGLQRLGGELSSAAARPEAILEELLDRFQARFGELVQERHGESADTLRKLFPEILREVNERRKSSSGLTGLPTGYSKLDRMTLGLQASDLIILAARPSVGKTSLALNVAVNIAQDRKRVAIFSLEMSAKQLVYRLLSSHGRLDAQELRTGKIDPNALIHATNRLQNCDIVIDDTPSISPLELRAKCRLLKRQGGLDLVVVDYLQLMQGPTLRRSDSKTQEISEISRALKGIARELDVPVLALSQLSRAVESRTGKRPQLSDLRESGAIEQDADLVCFLWRREEQSPDAGEESGGNRGGWNRDRGNLDDMRPIVPVHLILAKHRNGPTGEILLNFEKRYTQFTEIIQGGGHEVDFDDDY